MFRLSFKGAAKGLALRYQGSVRDYMIVRSCLTLTDILLFLYMSVRKKNKPQTVWKGTTLMPFGTRYVALFLTVTQTLGLYKKIHC